MVDECSRCHEKNVDWKRTPDGMVMKRVNSRGELKPWLINTRTGKDHECLRGHTDERDVRIKNTNQRGMPCPNKCGKYIGRDPRLPEPQYREVEKVYVDYNTVRWNLNSGRHHTVERCIEVKEHYHIPLSSNDENFKNQVKLDAYNIIEGESFNPDVQFNPSDLFRFNKRTGSWERNPKYHDDFGNYTGPRSNLYK